ncbi:MAG: DUF2442 domain-containing protein [Chlorobaculum sp.]|nr:DUF2442 domain-containing protein [Chlorobaculum sp.]
MFLSPLRRMVLCSAGKWEGKGHGIYWPDLDEDISVEWLLAGKRSGESQESR